MEKKIPEEIIRHILEFNTNKIIYNLFKNKTNNIFFYYYISKYYLKLSNCHKELMKKRPCYYKVSVAGFTPGISDSPTWHNFKRNSTIIESYYINGVLNHIELELFAIEITPETYNLKPEITTNDKSRDIRLYYGWKRLNDQQFLNEIRKAHINKLKIFSPGFY